MALDAESNDVTPHAGGDRSAELALSTRALRAWRIGHAEAVGAPCANCAIAIEGPFCLSCGQAAKSFERSVGALLMEAFESLAHADGRLPTTLRRLCVRPAALTRDYLSGRRAVQTPPLRLFLVVMLIVFFSGNLSGLARSGPGPALFVRDSPSDTLTVAPGRGPVSQAFAHWANPRLAYAIDHQSEFGAVLEGELHTTAVVFLPIAALLLGAIFVFDRRYFLFDHAIFAMHSLSFMGLLFSVVTIIELIPASTGLAGLLAVSAPIHLFLHLRGVYSTSIVGTLARMLILFAGSVLAVLLLLAVDVGLGLNAFRG
jgi:hypothetical protein